MQDTKMGTCRAYVAIHAEDMAERMGLPEGTLILEIQRNPLCHSWDIYVEHPDLPLMYPGNVSMQVAPPIVDEQTASVVIKRTSRWNGGEE